MIQCKEKTINGSSITGTVGWGVFGLSLLMLFIFIILRMFSILEFDNLYFWIILIFILIGGFIGVIGYTILNICKLKEVKEEESSLF